MFGYIKPNLPELRVREKERYEAWYCGLCRRLGKRCGQAARLLLSYDCAFLAMLVSAAAGGAPPCEKHTCPVRPLAGKKLTVRECAALDYAADVCVILGKYKLDDDVRDGRPLRRAASLPLLHAFRKARRNRPELYKAVGERIAELVRIEEEKEKSVDLAANCCGEMMRAVFAEAPFGDAEGGKEILSEIGYWVGRFVYLIDAWDDREKDAKHGLYNPFNLCGTSQEDAEYEIDLSINSAISAYNLIGSGRSVDLAVAENVFFEGFFAAWDELLRKKAAEKAKHEQRKTKGRTE